jgi:hypothetical protein
MMSATISATASSDREAVMAEKEIPVVALLQAAAEGLQFPSETDAPIEPVAFPGAANGPVDARRILELTHPPGKAPVRIENVDDFFAPVTREQSWQNAQERQTVARFQQLVRVLKDNLADLQVFKIGGAESDVYVLGKTGQGDLAGIKTKVVET